MQLPELILSELHSLASSREVYAAGGPVRDMLLSRTILDLDLVLAKDAIEAARVFAAGTMGTLVVLDEKHDVARVVSGETVLDFSGFRDGASSIEADLKKRDFTINAMALPLATAITFFEKIPPSNTARQDITSALLDPAGGMHDLEARTIRALSRENLAADPLRLVRIFRFMAQLDFSVDPLTLSWISPLAPRIKNTAPERINSELNYILNTRRAGKVFHTMHGCLLLQEILPELTGLEGVEQPGFHHLDVLEHCFETLACMDVLVNDPSVKFPVPGQFNTWLNRYRSLVPALKWAAFMHDWGKPARKGEKNGRVTFYNHDTTGAEMAGDVGQRLRWKHEHARFTTLIIQMHMRPFHLLTDFRMGGPSKRAMRRLLEKTASHYPALFLQAMADSMAGCGPLKPAGLDDELAALATKVHRFYQKRMSPAKKAPRLLTGTDIMSLFGLKPGPDIGRLLKAVESARIEGEAADRKDAINLVSRLLSRKKQGT